MAASNKQDHLAHSTAQLILEIETLTWADIDFGLMTNFLSVYSTEYFKNAQGPMQQQIILVGSH